MVNQPEKGSSDEAKSTDAGEAPSAEPPDVQANSYDVLDHFSELPPEVSAAWNEIIDGFNRGRGFTLAVGFIPFAKTRESRVASKDPRLSLEERYGDHAGFVRRVREVVIQQVAQGWLLQEDADRLVKQAEESTVLLDSGAM
jgi:hypothetical protein